MLSPSETFGRSVMLPCRSRSLAGTARSEEAVSIATVATVFAILLPAELPDKSAIASVALGVRYRTWPVLLGVAAGFAVHVLLAVAAGGALSLLPDRLLHGIVGGLFLIGAAWLTFWPTDTSHGDTPPPTRSVVGTAAVSFTTIVLAELGDITQVVTANLTAQYHDPISVGIGALGALWTVAAIAVFGGRGLLRFVPARLLMLLAATTMVGFGVANLVQTARG